MKGTIIKPTLTLLTTLLLASGHAAEFYVAATGDDANPGTRTKPFATLERARDAARQSKGSTVFVRGGFYELTKTLKLDAKDSGVIWRAYRDEKPILVGGVKITGFVPHDGQIVKANVGTNLFRQLFFDGQRQELARYPNLDPA
ncbi:MAG: hypothetical protein FJ224_13290, partial [Lentisphaerae bacterium]|nr:hypothetical protein [Lentisphaerota bacterium]